MIHIRVRAVRRARGRDPQKERMETLPIRKLLPQAYPPPLCKLCQCTQLLRSLAYCTLDKGVACAQHIQLPHTPVRRPHALKLAIQDLWDASD